MFTKMEGENGEDIAIPLGFVRRLVTNMQIKINSFQQAELKRFDSYFSFLF